MKNENELEKKLTELLNSYSVENYSDTPDYILSRFMIECLEAYNTAVRQREHHMRDTHMLKGVKEPQTRT